MVKDSCMLFWGISFIYRFNNEIQTFLDIDAFFILENTPHDIIKAGLE